MSKPHLIFQGTVLEDADCSSCERHTRGPLHYTMIYRSDRRDNSHYLMCEHCATAIEIACARDVRRTRTIGAAQMPQGEL